LAEAGYRVGALVVDAAQFVPQSRPRLFIICAHAGAEPRRRSVTEGPSNCWHGRVHGAYERLSAKNRRNWIWWNPPEPPPRKACLSDLIEENPRDVAWFSKDYTDGLMAKMSELHRARLQQEMRAGCRRVGCLYRRTRRDEYGRRAQRAEV